MINTTTGFIKGCLLGLMLIQQRGILLHYSYADDSQLPGGYIGPHQQRYSAFTFQFEEDQQINNNQVTIFVANDDSFVCNSLESVHQNFSKVSLSQGETLLGEQTSAQLSGDNCVYSITINTNTIASGQTISLDLVTIDHDFDPEGSMRQFALPIDGFTGEVMHNATQIQHDTLGNTIQSELFYTLNPSISQHSLVNSGTTTQLEYNNGRFTGFALNLYANNASDLIISGALFHQIGTSRIGPEGYNNTHHIQLIDDQGTVVAETSLVESSTIEFENLNITIPAGSYRTVSMVIIYSGDIVDNNFRFAGSFDIYDSAGHPRPYLVDIPGISIDILQNQVIAAKTQDSNHYQRHPNWSGDFYLGQVRLVSTSHAMIEGLSFVNLAGNITGSSVDSITLGCETVEDCAILSHQGDNLRVILFHEGSIVSSGVISGGVTTLTLSDPLMTDSDHPRFFDLYIEKPSEISHSYDTNKYIKLGLLNTHSNLTQGGNPLETVVRNTIDNSIMPASFDNIIYQNHRIRKSWLTLSHNANSGVQDLYDIDNSYHTILNLQLHSTGGDSSIQSITFDHSSSGVIASDFNLVVNGTIMSGDELQCHLSGSLITCISTGDYQDGLSLPQGINTIDLHAYISPVEHTGDFIRTSFISSTGNDYGQYGISSLIGTSRLIWSDQADYPSSITGTNRFTDAGIISSPIHQIYSAGDYQEQSIELAELTGFHYSQSPIDYNQYLFYWDATNEHTSLQIQIENPSNSGYYNAGSFVGSNGSGALYLPIDGVWNIKFVAIDNHTHEAVSLEKLVTINHVTSPTPFIVLRGESPVTVEGGHPYEDAGAEYVDVEEGTGLIVDYEGSVDVYQTGEYIITYHYTDHGVVPNTVQLSRTVNVVDTTPPLITLSGASTIHIPYQAHYNEYGAAWSDLMDGEGEASISGSVNSSHPGDYVITYYHRDRSGNLGSSSRVVTVAVPDVPAVILNGEEVVIIEQGEEYVEYGATWRDALDGSGSISEASSGSVDNSTPGYYTLEYYYINSTEHHSNTVTRVVIVQQPVLILGSIWFDTNKDGLRGSGENAAYEVTVDLYQCGSSGSGFVSQTQTNHEGGYLFTGLAAGYYQLTAHPLTGYILSQSGSSCLYADHNITGLWSTSLIAPPDNNEDDESNGSGNHSTTSANHSRTGGSGAVTTNTGGTIYNVVSSPVENDQVHYADDHEDVIVTIQIGKNGEIIIVNPNDVIKPTFTKDLPRSSSGYTLSGNPMVLKPYSIITAEMLRNVSTISDHNTAWDRSPRGRQRQLDPRLHTSSWD